MPTTATQVFNDHRDLLFSIVYNMLGSVADTEDVVQETWLSWTTRNRAPSAERIDNPRAYLVRIAVNGALAHQAAFSRRRETYVGPWLPEPLVSALTDTPTRDDAADAAVRAESVSMALLVVLETLTPLERGVRAARAARGVRLRPHRDRGNPRPQSRVKSAATRRSFSTHKKRPPATPR